MTIETEIKTTTTSIVRFTSEEIAQAMMGLARQRLDTDDKRAHEIHFAWDVSSGGLVRGAVVTVRAQHSEWASGAGVDKSTGGS